MKKTRAFTLVELIVVITILAILWTIWFISLQGYSVNARDSVRIADTKTFIKALNIYQTKEGQVPLPDDLTTITGSGTIFSYQGTLWNSVITALGQGAVPLDPVLKTPYLYATNEGQTKFQLLSYHEKNNAAVPLTSQGYAEYTDMFPKVIWDPIGILLNEDNNPVASGSLNLTSETGPYKYLISNERIATWTGGDIALHTPKASCKRILESSGSLPSGVYSINPTGNVSHEIYCDMETDGGGWTRVAYEDYESGTATWWTVNTVTTCGEYGKIIGGYGILWANSYNQKSFTLLDVIHTEVRVALDYIKIDSWDTGEDPIFKINEVDHELHEEEIFPVRAKQFQICWNNTGYWNEFSFHIDEWQPSSTNEATIYVSSTINSYAYDESYGHDNLEVFIR